MVHRNVMAALAGVVPAGSLGGGFLVWVFLGATVAGTLGSLVGLGGGILIIPLLTLGFGVHIHYAIGTSIVSVIATSTGAAVAYIGDRLTNIRVGIFLELATTSGALAGAFLAGMVSPQLLFLVFGAVLMFSILPLVKKLGEELPAPAASDPWAIRLGLADHYEDKRLGRRIAYHPTHVWLAFPMMGLAGLISGLLGIGAGVFKVLAMDLAMRLPMKVSTATSNFMIGVTAAASAWVYLARGYIHPLVTAPVLLGTLLGAFLGSRLMERMSNRGVRLLFIPLLLVISVQMIRRGLVP